MQTNQLFFKLSFKVLIVSFVFVFGGCGESSRKGAEEEAITLSEAQARAVSYITYGNIHQDDQIKITFNNEMVDEAMVGEELSNKAVTLSPQPEGKWKWENVYTLVFRPAGLLPARKTISGELDMSVFGDEYKELEVIKFYVSIQGRELDNFTGDIALKIRDNPKLLVYKGSVSFTEPTDISEVQKAAALDGRKDIALTWSKISDRSFQFISNDIEREDKTTNYSFSLDKDDLQLGEDFEKTITIHPLKDMTVVELLQEEDGKLPRVRIKFSDDLDIEQNLDGFVSVTPAVEFQAKKLGSYILIDGKFKFGSAYQISVNTGVRSAWGTTTKSAFKQSISFADIEPQLEFASDGIILPSGNNQKIQFYTTNVKRVHVELKKVFTTHVGTFLDSEQLTSKKSRKDAFNSDYSRTSGVILKNKTLEIGDTKNEWLLNELDLKDLFATNDDGLYLLRINFNPDDMLVAPNGNAIEQVQEFGQIYKPVFVSDIGLTLKKNDTGTDIFTTDLNTGQPMSGVKVSFLDYSGSTRSSSTTSGDGHAYNDYGYYSYAVATKGNEITALTLNEMQWSSTGFDIAGVSNGRREVRGFIYTERGVYRPGDSVHVSLIARNSSNTFPDRHPAVITVRDPERNIVHEATINTAKDGFYVFGFVTDEDAATGNYQVVIETGDSYFYETLKIETVVADKLKVSIVPDKPKIYYSDHVVKFNVESIYLFGAPAANLDVEVEAEITSATKRFPKFDEYNFTNQSIEFTNVKNEVFKGSLNEKGIATINWALPSMPSIPSAIRIKLNAKVLEKGGRPNEGWKYIDYDPYPSYIGVKEPSGYGYYQVGKEINFPVVLLSPEGEPVTGKELKYKIYRNTKHWWYQYDNRRRYQLKYKEDNQTSLASEGAITSGTSPTMISYRPEEDGEYLIEVYDPNNGHTSAFFFSSYRYGSVPGGDLNEGTLALKTDKKSYEVGDKAKIKLPNPKQGKVLFTVEKGDDLLQWKWVDPAGDKDELEISLDITSEMVPNAYVTISVIQPHEQTVNDRPIRMFGIVPIMAIDPKTKTIINIETAKSFSPNETFEVKLSTADGRPTQFTIAVVDEGLLSLTQFKTPDPWKEFFKKIALQLRTFDIFAHVISKNKADIFQTFSIGGDEDMSYRESQTDPTNGKKRFKPVSMFKGPISTDGNGKATVKFNMPNYNGAVRIMVVSARSNAYGTAEKSVPVLSDLIMQPTIPRVLHPGDEFTLPVSLFKINPKVGKATFKLAASGPLQIVGKEQIDFDFTGKDEGDISFRVKVKQEIGQGQIVLTGNAGSINVSNETDIMVIPTSARVYEKNTVKVEKGSSAKFTIPDRGITGTNFASVDMRMFPNMDFEHRLKWLIRYPYGCIEQTTSSVFPQLYLKKMGYFDESQNEEIDNNINEGIRRLQLFTVSNGGFSYWPGGIGASGWGTNYATHFLIEAKNLGYAVPEYLLDNAKNYLKGQARQHNGELMERVNRVFVLSLAKEAPIGEMNLLLQNELANMKDVQKWMLAAAYKLSGVDDTSNQILSQTGQTIEEYEPFSYSYGSRGRDEAIILYSATLMNKMTEAELLAKSIAAQLSATNWMSTHTSGYMILALGKFFEKSGIAANNSAIIRGTIKLADGTSIPFENTKKVIQEIKANFGKTVEVAIDAASTMDQVYVTMSWNGVPVKDESVTADKNMGLTVRWYNDQGDVINPADVRQGTTMWGRFTVSNESPLQRLDEIALVQLLPSGWEIENTRLTNEMMPNWMSGWKLGSEEYFDLRDDRVMWFFDIKKGEPLDFVVKINTVTAGTFWLPGSLTEAMYNDDFKSTKAGQKIVISPFK